MGVDVLLGAAAISIHAPRVGSDTVVSPRLTPVSYFNPRSPCGERLGLAAGVAGEPDFNPRSPCGERLCLAGARRACDEISIHAPRVGSDGMQSRSTAARLKFQSTLPVWGATRRHRRHLQHHQISIHAPRVGSDRIGAGQKL